MRSVLFWYVTLHICSYLSALGTTCRSRLQGSSSPNKSRVITDVREQPVRPDFKGQAVQLESRVVIYRRLGTTYRSNLLESSNPRKMPGTGITAYFSRYSSWSAWPLKFGPTGCSQTSVNNHSLHRVTSQQSENLKSVIVFSVSFLGVGLMNTKGTVRCVMYE